ncbi:hypothetical protein ABEB36_003075, partial [Hypothenemus hampei]
YCVAYSVDQLKVQLQNLYRSLNDQPQQVISEIEPAISECVVSNFNECISQCHVSLGVYMPD